MTKENNFKKINRSPLFLSFRDVCIYLSSGFIVVNLKNLIRSKDIFLPSTPHAIKISFIIFMTTWLATYIACKMGVSTFVTGWDKSGMLWKRVPGTLAVMAITSFLAFIILLFSDQIHE